ncbi:methyl-accepting chemotaxis protein [Orrella sp. JC864]|uniref:methyl-accepting chemotaxis protein n=1 Tax=Orrella sp. JC864 TaxID=3120298 RepID=UPI00300B7DF9
MQASHNVAELSLRIDHITSVKIGEIKAITLETRLLSLNAAIEASHVGEAGRSFAVVAGRVREVSDRIEALASSLQDELRDVGLAMQQALRRARGQRLADLARNVIETIDRNLYERTCDVRWWATESAVQALAAAPGPQRLESAQARLGIILDTYTVYLDIWVIGLDGKVLCNGRPQDYPQARGHDVRQQPWFRQALACAGPQDYAAGDVQPVAALEGASCAVYAATIHADPDDPAARHGVLAVFFDWSKQAASVVKGIRLDAEEAATVRCMVVDASQRVIAASADDVPDALNLPMDRQDGYYASEDGLVGYALTPGYETYAGLGWYGVVMDRGQRAP